MADLLTKSVTVQTAGQGSTTTQTGARIETRNLESTREFNNRKRTQVEGAQDVETEFADVTDTTTKAQDGPSVIADAGGMKLWHGMSVSFEIEIMGGLQNVPAGETPPESACPE